MATPEPLYLQVAEDWAVYERLWDRAEAPDSPGGPAVVQCEIVQLQAFRRERLSPRIPLLTATVAAIRSLVGTHDGIDGKRFIRNCLERWGIKRWGKKKGDNVVDLFPRVPLDAA